MRHGSLSSFTRLFPTAGLAPLLAAALPLLLPSAARAGEAVATVASHVVVTERRTLLDAPLKGLITTATGWRRVTEGLAGAPPAPDFAAGQVGLLVVADARGAANAVEAVERAGSNDLRVVLVRREGVRADDPSLPRLEAFFFTLAADPGGGVALTHRTVLPEGMGTVERTTPAVPSDRDPRGLPRLGPDLRLALGMADGSEVPPGIKLRVEVYYARKGLPGRVVDVPFPAEGLIFPELRDGARFVYAAYGEGLRSQNALVLDALPPPGPGGGAPPLQHRFLLEPAPEGGRSR